MKVCVRDPVQAALRFGGATWEPGIGWWTQSPGPTTQGMPFNGRRDAIYVPSKTRFGSVVSSVQISAIR